MTQLQFEMICKIIKNGAPALADELCGALNNFVAEYNKLAEDLSAVQEAAKDVVKNADTKKSK